MIICPWTIYACYGDERLLEKHYEAMAHFVDHRASDLAEGDVAGEAGDGAAERFEGYGDWLSVKAETPKELIRVAFTAYSARLLSRIATALGKAGDADRYERLYQDTRRTFIERYVTPGGLVLGHTQTAYVLALHFDLLPEHLRPAAVQALVRDIKGRKMHLSTGFVGTPYLLQVLTEAGRADVAYGLLNQKSYPSWLYPVTQGATTIWERWDGWRHDEGFQDPSMNSFNHYAYGAVGAWLYAVVAGIDVDVQRPGYKHVVMRPRPGGGLTYAKATYESLYGRIVSDWRLEKGVLDWRITVPPNATATLYVPARADAQIVEGEGPADQAQGVTALRREPQAAVYAVVAGSYRFRVSQPYVVET